MAESGLMGGVNRLMKSGPVMLLPLTAASSSSSSTNGHSHSGAGSGSGSADVRFTKIILASMAIFWLLGMTSQFAYDLLAFIPGYLFSRYNIWTLVTAGFFETSFFMGIINMTVFVMIAPLVERAWGGPSFLKFLLVVNASVFCGLFLIMVLCYAVTDIDAFIFQGICGFSGMNAALSVALKQRWPDRALIAKSPFDVLKLKHIPVVILTLSLALSLAGQVGGKEAPLVSFGVLFGWIYLRFFFSDPDTGAVGDLRPEFSFATLFPDIPALRPFLELISTILFQLAIRVGLFQQALRSQQQQQSSSNANNSSMGASLPVAQPVPQDYRNIQLGGVDPLAERRRQLAIKAIDEKLAELSRQPAGVAASGLGLSQDTNSIALDLGDLDAQLAASEAALNQPFASFPDSVPPRTR